MKNTKHTALQRKGLVMAALLAVVLLTLTACGGSTPAGGSSGMSTPTESSPAASTPAESGPDASAAAESGPDASVPIAEPEQQELDLSGTWVILNPQRDAQGNLCTDIVTRLPDEERTCTFNVADGSCSYDPAAEQLTYTPSMDSEPRVYGVQWNGPYFRLVGRNVLYIKQEEMDACLKRVDVTLDNYLDYFEERSEMRWTPEGSYLYFTNYRLLVLKEQYGPIIFYCNEYDLHMDLVNHRTRMSVVVDEDAQQFTSTPLETLPDWEHTAKAETFSLSDTDAAGRTALAFTLETEDARRPMGDVLDDTCVVMDSYEVTDVGGYFYYLEKAE